MTSRPQVKNQAKAQALALMGGCGFLMLFAVLVVAIFLALVGAGSDLAFFDGGWAGILSVSLAGVVMAVLGSLRDQTAWAIIPRTPAEGHPFSFHLSHGRQLARPNCTFRPPRLFS